MRFIKGLIAPAPVIAAVAVVLLLTAGLAGGKWAWLHAWAFLAVYGGISMTASGLLAVTRPASFAVRQQGAIAAKAKKQPLIDALGLIGYLAFALGWLVFIGLDVVRLHLMAPPSGAVAAAGLAAVIAGQVIGYMAFAQNPFAAPSIHDQSGEGQRVIDTGLYGVVRHPFYAGMLLVYAGAALWLGSYAGAIAASGFLALTLARILIEEAWLRDHVTGYADYAHRVRGRLIPYVL
jgi:protein-S-isoprenylcysteine O-methyltransferase Ste14